MLKLSQLRLRGIGKFVLDALFEIGVAHLLSVEWLLRFEEALSLKV